MFSLRAPTSHSSYQPETVPFAVPSLAMVLRPFGDCLVSPMSVSFCVLVAIIAPTFVRQTNASPFPLPPLKTSSLATASDSPLSCNDLNNCRTMWDIVWSSAITISLCTWASYHPDLPDQSFTQMRVVVIRVLAVFISFVMPEVVVIRAVEQWWEVQRYKSPFKREYLCKDQCRRLALIVFSR